MATAVAPGDEAGLGPWRAAPAFVLGLGLATGHAPLGWIPVALVSLVLLFLLFGRAQGVRAAALVGWAAGFGHFAGALFWIVEPFFVDPVRHGWMAPFALVLLPGGLALFWAAAFALAARLGRGWARPLLLACLLAASDYLRGIVFTGFPWAMIGHIWIGGTQMQVAALVGPHGLTLMTTLAAAASTVWVGRGRGWMVMPALALAVLAAADIWGAARLLQADERPFAAPVIRVVQPNAEQSLKWDPDRAREFLRRLLAETAARPLGPFPDVVVWPETAVPYLLNSADDLVHDISRAAAGAPVLFGIVRREGQRVFNSMAVVGFDGRVASVYDKHHLTPFGEYVPFGDLLAKVGIHGLAASEGQAFTPGPGPVALPVPGAGKVVPLICYEAIFPSNLRVPERPDWIVQITNDAWFGEVAGPYQHLAQARLRAVEQGLPLVRAANTGVSAVIDPKGRIVEALPLGVTGHFDVTLPAPLGPTPYARFGDLPVLALLAFFTFLFTLAGSRKSV